MPEQSTFGSCLNRTVDDRLFGLTEEERELRGTIQQFCKREVLPLAEVSKIGKIIKQDKDKDKDKDKYKDKDRDKDKDKDKDRAIR